MELANLDWRKGQTTVEVLDDAHRTLRQMAILYVPHGQDKEITLEFHFTDLDKTYQLVLGQQNCAVKTNAFSPAAARIETPFTVWTGISTGAISGEEALFQHKYRVLGDFQAFNLLTTCFPRGKKPAPKNNAAPEKRAMWLFIIPWAALWIASPLSPDFGVYFAVLIAATIPLFSRIRKLTPYDTIGAWLVIVLGLLTVVRTGQFAGFNLAILVTLSYGIFGLIWLCSLFFPVPLSAWYSAAGYGGDAAFSNRLFIMTNRILTAGWGALYLCTAAWTWFIMHSYYAQLAGLINMACPILMGIFTAWFAKWFPAHYAQRSNT
jgi:hypothetical protein